jgi:hypothetical protein
MSLYCGLSCECLLSFSLFSLELFTSLFFLWSVGPLAILSLRDFLDS